MEAEALFHRGDFSGAAALGEQAAVSAGAKEQLSITLASMFLRQRLLLLEGEYRAARTLLDDMRVSIRSRSAYYYLHTLDLCEGELLATLGRTEGAAAWLKQGAGGEDRLYHFAGGYYYIVHGGILLSEKRWDEVIGLYSWLFESGAFSNNLLLAIHARLFLAAANQALGRTAEAEAELRHAGGLAFPDSIIMPFVQQWRFLEDIPADEGNAAAIFSRIRALAGQWESRRRGILSKDFPPERPVLTERELELARMAAAGMLHREIAKSVYLAPSTVKRAFATIYNKLGISSREELKVFLEQTGSSD
jgi:LuxR family maltose regulon positive regulatory protein